MQGVAFGGTTFGLKDYLSGNKEFPGAASRKEELTGVPQTERTQMTTQFWFSTRINDLVAKVHNPEHRKLHPMTTPQKGPLHVMFHAQEQPEEFYLHLTSVLAQEGSRDSSNSNAIFAFRIVSAS